ncbi:MAG: MarR family winged helix-turn-helix transcriptional regulator [Porticoccaceae bacterium]
MAAKPLSKSPLKQQSGSFIDRYLAYLLARASHRISSGFHRQLSAMDVSVSTWRIIASLQSGSVSVGELAKRVLLAQPTLSKALDRLATEGLLLRERAPDNRRSVRVELTPAGQYLLDQLIPIANQYESACFDHLSDAERSQLVALLQKAIV